MHSDQQDKINIFKKNNPRVTAKGWNQSFELVKVSVYEFTIPKTW